MTFWLKRGVLFPPVSAICPGQTITNAGRLVTGIAPTTYHPPGLIRFRTNGQNSGTLEATHCFLSSELD